jgi:hypothetical protein
MAVRRILVGTAAMAGFIIAYTGIAAAFTPRPGTYQGTVNGLPTSGGHNEGEGYFKLTASGKNIVAVSRLGSIHAPTDFICKAGQPTASSVITAKKIRVTRGAFDYKGTPAGTPGRHIRFKGHWTDRKHLVGFTKTTGGGCKHTARWKMKTPPPAP